MFSFWGDAANIPGNSNTIEFSLSANLMGFGIELDLTYVYAGRYANEERMVDGGGNGQRREMVMMIRMLTMVW